MLYNAFLVGIATLMALLIPFVGVYCFMRGYSMGVKDYNTAHSDEPKADPERKAKPVSHASDKRLNEMLNLLDNIENYDGTDANQKEIK